MEESACWHNDKGKGKFSSMSRKMLVKKTPCLGDEESRGRGACPLPIGGEMERAKKEGGETVLRRGGSECERESAQSVRVAKKRSKKRPGRHAERTWG